MQLPHIVTGKECCRLHNAEVHAQLPWDRCREYLAGPWQHEQIVFLGLCRRFFRRFERTATHTHRKGCSQHLRPPCRYACSRLSLAFCPTRLCLALCVLFRPLHAAHGSSHHPPDER